MRPLTVEDAAAVRPLLGQLGYDLDEAETACRIAAVAAAPGHCLLALEEEGAGVVGLLHVYGRPALEKPPEAIVQALVVQDGRRGQGLGRRMMAAAEDWAAGAGYRFVVLHSQVGRAKSHTFYDRLGYARAATSYLYRRAIDN